jgi:hypothetical protein
MMTETPRDPGAETDATDGAVCRLCGLPLRGRPDDSGAFCCLGCARVHDVLQGLDESAGGVYLEAARRLGIIPGADAAAPAGEPPLPDDPAAIKEERFRVEGMSTSSPEVLWYATTCGAPRLTNCAGP